jgi:hypothetical protein
MSPHAKYGQKNTAQKVFNLATPIHGRDPKVYRKDPEGKTIKFDQHGTSNYGSWDIDHIKPKSLGGSNDIRNLQALNSSSNRRLGNSLNKKSRHNNK